MAWKQVCKTTTYDATLAVVLWDDLVVSKQVLLVRWSVLLARRDALALSIDKQ